jgi:glutathione synthase/RimK-type ligase-like ATP-grasp enzyme
MKRIGFVTSADLSRFIQSASNPLITFDDQFAADVLIEHGFRVDPVIWGTPICELSEFDLLVMRSAWDYFDSEEKSHDFLRWIRAVGEAEVALQNPAGLMLWSLDKHYLRDLKDAGVAVVPTDFIEPDDIVSCEDLAERCEKSGPFVLKPACSAGARDTFLIESPADAHNLSELNGKVEGDFHAWRNARSFLMQPFLTDIRENGEWSLIFIGGKYSHAVRKLPAKGQWLVQDELGGSVEFQNPPAEVIALATEAADATRRMFYEMLYARVDVLKGNNGQWLVGEIELVEPELFFRHGHGTELFCEAIKKLVA